MCGDCGLYVPTACLLTSSGSGGAVQWKEVANPDWDSDEEEKQDGDFDPSRPHRHLYEPIRPAARGKKTENITKHMTTRHNPLWVDLGGYVLCLLSSVFYPLSYISSLKCTEYALKMYICSVDTSAADLLTTKYTKDHMQKVHKRWIATSTKNVSIRETNIVIVRLLEDTGVQCQEEDVRYSMKLSGDNTNYYEQYTLSMVEKVASVCLCDTKPLLIMT